MKNLIALPCRLFVLALMLYTVNAPARTLSPTPVGVPETAAPAPAPTEVEAGLAKRPFAEKILTRILEKKLKKYVRKQGLSAGVGGGEKKKNKKGDNWNAIAMGFGIASVPLIALAFLSYVPLANFLLLFGVIFGVLGLVFGIVGVKKEYKHRGMGIAAIIAGGSTLGALVIALLGITIAAIILLY